MPKLQDPFPLAHFPQRRRLGVAERGIAPVDDLLEIRTGDTGLGDEQAEDPEGQVREGERPPGRRPVRGKDGDPVGNVQSAVGRESAKDGLAAG